MSHRPRRLLTVFAVGAAALLLTACTPTVALDPAAGANNPRCADVIVHLPDTVAGKAKRETNAQATAAWGDPAVVLLRCGVTPIGPTTKPCITVNGIDWVLENNPIDTDLRYITFGRVPATEIVIAHGKGGVTDASVLPDLADAISFIPQKKQQKCLSTADVTSPTVTPTPLPSSK
ncbi:DUF3515 family protein [Humibacter ginsenosidimutans]|uniref:DUF3515 family protein n=1 Tax=Humibacter ginsenosidimutans TaxID=2599293 RepID=A0A5B8M1G5_9MICO|nr:DUF3515 family protein [Humibacter ginsenosidimutans]QDZ14116.1 DUF3515 family protein [Humibacter ginsenosidimutans]